MFPTKAINDIAVLYAVWNIFVFAIYGIDKIKAINGKWRVKESTLLLMGRFFGGIGQIAAMRFFRHKTKKWYFVVSGVLSVILQMFVLMMILKRLYL